MKLQNSFDHNPGVMATRFSHSSCVPDTALDVNKVPDADNAEKTSEHDYLELEFQGNLTDALVEVKVKGEGYKTEPRGKEVEEALQRQLEDLIKIGPRAKGYEKKCNHCKLYNRNAYKWCRHCGADPLPTMSEIKSQQPSTSSEHTTNAEDEKKSVCNNFMDVNGNNMTATPAGGAPST